MKSIIKKILPPILLDIFRNFKRKKIFTGPFSYKKIPNENVWSGSYWISLSQSKLKNIDLVKKYKYDYFDILTLFLNTIIKEGRSIKVLDWGGGTGFGWFNIYKKIYKPEKVEWNVVDSKILHEIGEKYSKQNKIPIKFFENIDYLPETNYDIVYINTSIQYIDNFQNLLIELLKKQPKHIILTRLLVSKGTENLTFCQTIGEKVTPCTFISENNLIRFLLENSYEQIFNSPCWDECMYLSSCLPDESKEILGRYISKDIIFSKITS